MNQDMIPLNRVPEGRVARVIDLFTTGNMRRRLQDIGLIEGTDVECLQKSPAGDPVAYYIRGRSSRCARRIPKTYWCAVTKTTT